MFCEKCGTQIPDDKRKKYMPDNENKSFSNDKDMGKTYPERAMRPPRNLSPDPSMGAVYAGPINPATLVGYAGSDEMSGMRASFAVDSNMLRNDEDMIICKACGAKMPKKGKFCPECGSTNAE